MFGLIGVQSRHTLRHISGIFRISKVPFMAHSPHFIPNFDKMS